LTDRAWSADPRVVQVIEFMREIIRQANIATSILAHPLGLSLCLGPDSAVDVESRVARGKQTFCPFGAEEFPAAELAHQPAVVLGEDPRR
jgi:hypothetical protein